MISNKIKLIAIAFLFVMSSGLEARIAGTSMVGSPHDLGSGSNTNIATNLAANEDNGEICVYCHTPHAANVGFDGAPLWNKKSPASLTYKMYGETNATANDAETIGGTAIDDSPTNSSLACLSCHDGVSGIDSIVNAPGSGAKSEVDNATAIQDALTTLYGGNIGSYTSFVDLSNDHPISIVYDAAANGAGVGSLKATNTALTDWVGADEISHLLRNGRVECGSCHDPHNGNKTDNAQGTNTEVNFLRVSNASSALCIGCHAK